VPFQETYSEAHSDQLRPKRNVLRSLQKEDTLLQGSKCNVRGSSFQHNQYKFDSVPLPDINSEALPFQPQLEKTGFATQTLCIRTQTSINNGNGTNAYSDVHQTSTTAALSPKSYKKHCFV